MFVVLGVIAVYVVVQVGSAISYNVWGFEKFFCKKNLDEHSES